MRGWVRQRGRRRTKERAGARGKLAGTSGADSGFGTPAIVGCRRCCDNPQTKKNVEWSRRTPGALSRPGCTIKGQALFPHHGLLVQIAENARGIVTAFERAVGVAVVDLPELVAGEVRIRIQRLDAAQRIDHALDLAVVIARRTRL